jgi:hypothetical protein
LLPNIKPKSRDKVLNLSDFRTKKPQKKSQIKLAEQQIFIFADQEIKQRFALIQKKIELIKHLLLNDKSK